jgi:hypothetical protein
MAEYDPLGLVCPVMVMVILMVMVIVKSKMMLRKLYGKTAGLGWDSSIPRYLLLGKYPILITQGAGKLMCVCLCVCGGGGSSSFIFYTGCRETNVCVSVCLWRW